MNTVKNRSDAWFLGDMEPINESVRNSTPDQRQVSFRWLSGSVLAGATSLVLMGGALLTAFDGVESLSIPTSASLAGDALSATGAKSELAAKGGRLGINTDVADSSSNVMMVSTIARVNDRDVVKVRPFLVVQAPLAIAPKRKFKYPKFNPLTVFSESGKPEPISKSSNSIYGADVESEVSIRVTQFLASSPLIALTSRQRTVEIEEIVRQAAPSLTGSTTSIASLSSIDPTRFSISGEETFLAPGVIITAENVSTRSKVTPEDYQGIRYEGRVIRVRAIASLESILVAEGMNDSEANVIQQVLSSDTGNQALRPGDTIRLAYRVSSGNTSIARISLYRGTNHLVSVARSDTDQFVYSSEPTPLPQLAFGPKQKPVVTRAKLPSTYNGIYRAALSEGLTPVLSRTLIRIFAFDVDFRKKINPVDNLTAFVSLDEGQSIPNENSEILYASIKLNNVTRKYYRFRDADTGRVDYYDETGKSAKKFLLRKPVPNAKFRSPFGWRVHPISRVRKMHWGADWSAPRGTPIIAAGNGRVEKVGWAGGYGKRTILAHANGYKTYYNHQTAYAKGIKAGTRVRQGQIIGYVGTTGYSTGPHLHFEVSVNGNKVDPMRIRLPKGKVLKDADLAKFEAERDRIDELLKKREKSLTHLALN